MNIRTACALAGCLLGLAAGAAEPVRVACIGDSITFGYGLADRARESYPARLQTLLGTNFVVRNFGDSGRGYFRHTWRGKTRRGYSHRPAHAAALAWNPQIVICDLGINDADEYMRLWKDGGCPRFRADILATLEPYRRLPSRPLILMWTRLAPLEPGQKFFLSPAPFLMEKELSEAAVLLDAVPLDMSTPLAGRGALSRDHIHPNAAGADLIARATAAALGPFLARKFSFTLPAWCASHAVLPADRAFTLRGTAVPGTRVGTPFGEVTAAPSGAWSVAVPPRPASLAPVSWTFTPEGAAPVRLDDLVFGDVWLCAGQSNMVMPLSRTDGRLSGAFAANAATGAVRMLSRVCAARTDPGAWSAEMLAAVRRGPLFTGDWQRLDAARARTCSALGVLLADGLAARNPGRPVGVIVLAVGGAPAESFAPAWLLARHPDLLPVLTARAPYGTLAAYLPAWPKARLAANLANVPPAEQNAVPHPFAPGVIWNGALAGLDGLPYVGALWYLGESNASTALSATDDDALPAGYGRATIEVSIEALRAGDPSRRIAMVELVGHMRRPWEDFRAAQHEVAARNGVILVPTDDLGDPADVHPRDKSAIISRLFALLGDSAICTKKD